MGVGARPGPPCGKGSPPAPWAGAQSRGQGGRRRGCARRRGSRPRAAVQSLADLTVFKASVSEGETRGLLCEGGRGLWKEGSSCRESEPYSFLIIQIAQALYYHINDMKHQHVLIKLNKCSTPGLRVQGMEWLKAGRGRGEQGVSVSGFTSAAQVRPGMGHVQALALPREQPCVASAETGAGTPLPRSPRAGPLPLWLAGQRLRCLRRRGASLRGERSSEPPRAVLQSPAAPRVRVRLPSAVTPPSQEDAWPLPRRVSGSG